MTSRNFIRRRKRIFVGCEGESEQAYFQVLAEIADAKDLNVHLQVCLIGEGAGSALAKVHKAIKEVAKFERRSGTFPLKYLVIDSDLVENAPQLKFDATRLAQERRIKIIWQQPCHEAFLLRHFPNCGALRPPTVGLARSKLKEAWQAYKKPMTKLAIAKTISQEHINQASMVEIEYAAFLAELGW